MDYFGWIQLALFVGLLVALTKPMGIYLVQVLDVEGKTFLAPVMGPVERLFYFVLGVDPQKEQDWKQYTFSLIAFSLVGALFTYAILRLAAHPAAESPRIRACQRSSLLQHSGKLYHQHQLAKLRRRINPVVLFSDGGFNIS